MPRRRNDDVGRYRPLHLDERSRQECQQLLAALLAREAPGGSTQELLNAFESLFGRLLAEFAQLIGARGAQGVLRRALHLVERHWPFISPLEVTESAGRFDILRRADPEPDATELGSALSDLFIAAVDVLTSLIGYDLAEPIVRRMDRSVEK